MRYVCHKNPDMGGGNPEGRNSKVGRLTELATARRSRSKKNKDPYGGITITEKNNLDRGTTYVPENDAEVAGQGEEVLARIDDAITDRGILAARHAELVDRNQVAPDQNETIDTRVDKQPETPDLLRIEIGPQAVEVKKATESWFGAMTKGARDMSAAAGRLLKEIDDKVGIKDGWEYGWKNIKDVLKGETATDWATGKSHLSGELAASTLAELAAELGVEPRAEQTADTGHLERTRQTAKYILGGFIGESIPKSPETAAISKQDKKELAAFMKEAGQELFLDSEQPELGDEDIENKEALKAVSKFENSTEVRMRNVVNEALGNITKITKFTAGGVVDLTRGYGKMLSWVGEQYRRIESLPREAAETNRKSELARQVAEAAKKRIEVAKAEMADNANLASKAGQDWRRAFTQERDALREQIDALERARLERISAITKQPEARITKQILQRQQANIEAKMGTLKPQYELLVQQLATLEALTPEAQQDSASA